MYTCSLMTSHFACHGSNPHQWCSCLVLLKQHKWDFQLTYGQQNKLYKGLLFSPAFIPASACDCAAGERVWPSKFVLHYRYLPPAGYQNPP